MGGGVGWGWGWGGGRREQGAKHLLARCLHAPSQPADRGGQPVSTCPRDATSPSAARLPLPLQVLDWRAGLSAACKPQPSIPPCRLPTHLRRLPINDVPIAAAVSQDASIPPLHLRERLFRRRLGGRLSLQQPANTAARSAFLWRDEHALWQSNRVQAPLDAAPVAQLEAHARRHEKSPQLSCRLPFKNCSGCAGPR